MKRENCRVVFDSAPKCGAIAHLFKPQADTIKKIASIFKVSNELEGPTYFPLKAKASGLLVRTVNVDGSLVASTPLYQCRDYCKEMVPVISCPKEGCNNQIDLLTISDAVLAKSERPGELFVLSETNVKPVTLSKTSPFAVWLPNSDFWNASPK